jgi:hypothetical protein
MHTQSDIQTQIQELKKNLHFSEWMTPLNLSIEREKFLAHPTQNPQFEYPEINIKNLTDIKNQLKLITITDQNPFETWINNRKIEEFSLQIDLIINRGEPEVSDITRKLYNCTFQPNYVAQAKIDSTSQLPFESKEHKTADEVMQGIRDYLKGYGIDDWQLILTDQSDFYFRVKASKKTILINKNFNWDFGDFDSMLAHEIDGHVIRGINASNQANALLRRPLPFYIKTEEGLASFLGDYCSTTSEITLKHHALKYLAGHLALSSSFKEIFEFLCDQGFTPALAFQRTFRLKRGFADSSIPGCFAKEAMYYEGMLEVKKYLDEGGDIKKLYSGKVGLADLEFIEIPEDIIIPQRIVDYLDN